MQMKYKLLITTISAVFLLNTSSLAEEQVLQIDEKTKYEIKIQAEKAIRTVAGPVQMALYTKTKEGGSKNAAHFCSTNAMTLAKTASKNLPENTKVRRITDKPRNKINLANAEQLKVLNELKLRLDNGEKIDMLVKQKSPNHYQVYKPLKVMSKCLNCHGTEETRDKESYKIISENYPEDKAMNYNLYDFRGAFLVDIIK